MVALSHKAKQYGWYALKVSFVFLAFVFIYQHIQDEDTASLQTIGAQFQYRNLPWGLLFIGIAACNWFLESLKWQAVISAVQSIPLSQAWQQSLAALTISLATPNRIGEYGAKVFYYPSEMRKKVLLLNFFSNATQMLITSVFGVLGFLLIHETLLPHLPMTKLLWILGLILVLGFVFLKFFRKKIIVQKASLDAVLKYFNQLPTSLKTRTLILSLMRYLVFSTHFYMVLCFFGAENTITETLPFIWVMYLCVSMIPMLSLFDVVVKGGVAIGLFHLIGIGDVIVLATVFSMWLFHFVIPSIFGTLYILKSYPQ